MRRWPWRPRAWEARQTLVSECAGWLRAEARPPLEKLFHDTEQLSAALESFGRHLHEDERARGDYVNLLLGVTDRRRTIRRRLQTAWDFNSLWRALMPGGNRLAMPRVVMQARVAVAFRWGWPLVAGYLLLTFGCLPRPTEHLSALRRGLVLPRDPQKPPLEGPLFLAVGAPKNAWAGARRQCARCDDELTILLWDALAVGSSAQEALWPASAARFTAR